MRTATDCTHRAEECRRLAKLAVRPEDFGHLLEMAETWELLAKQRRADEQVAEEHVAEEQVALAYEHVAEEQLTLPNEQVAEKQLTDEQVPLVCEHVADERVAELTDEQVADQQLVDVLALADAIANRRLQQSLIPHQ